MKRIIIVAIGAAELEKIVQMLRLPNVNICCTIVVPNPNIVKVINRYNLYPWYTYDKLPEIINGSYFDYVIVSDRRKVSGDKRRIIEELKRVKCPYNTIIDVSDFHTGESLPLYNTLKNYLVEDNTEYKFFITGVSHAYAGTDISKFSRNGLNLALTSQDLFLDYKLAEIVLSKKNHGIKYAIIGVAPFSLHYDLSISEANDYRMMMYYPIIKCVHNYFIKEDIIKDIFSDDYLNSFDHFEKKLVFKNRLYSNSFDKYFDEDDYANIRGFCDVWNERNYPDTKKENINYLYRYVSMCIENNVNPIFVIYPVSEFYNQYFPKKIFDELRYTLSEISLENDILFFDFSDDERFTLDDFFDIQHLNIKGAEKISKILDGKLDI